MLAYLVFFSGSYILSSETREKEKDFNEFITDIIIGLFETHDMSPYNCTVQITFSKGCVMVL